MKKIHTWYKVVLSFWIVVIVFFSIMATYSFRYKPTSDDFSITLALAILSTIGLIFFHFIIYNGIYMNYYKKYQQKNNLKKIEEITTLYKQKVITEDEYNEQIKKLKDNYLDNLP